MAIFTAIASFVAGAIGLTGAAATIFTAIGATVLSIGVSNLLLKNKLKGLSGGSGGGRVQLPPATDNKIPVVYGEAFIGGPITDARISADLKTMWYVVALAEHTDSTAGSGYTFDLTNVYYNGKKVQFGANGVVTGLINNTPSQTEIDTKVNGRIFIYLFTNGSNSPYNQSQPAYNIVPGWTSNDSMTNCAFAIIKVIYDEKAGTTSLGGLMVKIINSLDKPGSVIKDYLTNTRYGCAIPLSRIDTQSLDDLDDYSDEFIDYGTGTQARYRINGPVQTGENCLNNLNYLADSCDSWLQYSELTAKWKVVINKPYTGSISNLFLVDSSNLIGGINIAPINLNETYNQLEVAYPNRYIKDQTDYQLVELDDYEPGVMSPNEAINKLNVDYPYVNNSVQALYLGVRKLLQSREDLTISCKLDYSGIQIDAGDVIRVKHEDYGWDVLNGGQGKLFRVASVAEEKYSDGSLGVTISGFEYNGTIYDDRALLNFQPDPNTGLTDPNIISNPGTPNVSLNSDETGTISSFRVESYVPTTGSVIYMDFNYGNTSNVQQHILYRTLKSAAGTKFTNSDTNANIYTNLYIDINDLPAGTYYWSTVARNDFGGANSNVSNAFLWTGANINAANIVDGNGVYSAGNVLTSNNAIANITVNANVYLLSGTGVLANNTYITSVNSTTPTANFEITPTPLVPLANATIQVIRGGINGNTITPNTLPGNRVIANTMNGNVIIGNTLNGNVIISNTLNGNVIISNSVNGNVLISNTVNGNTIIANTINGNTIIANTLNGNTIIANTLNGNTIKANTINGNTIIANTLSGNTIKANTLFGNSIIANTVNGNTIIADTLSGNSIKANTLFGNSIVANSIQGNRIIANTMNGNVIIANTLNGNTITANTLNGNTIKANTIDGNTIIANTLNGNSIITNTLDGNVIKANTINGNTLIAGTLNGNFIQANTLFGNTIIANTLNGNSIIANTLNGNTIQANTINGISIIANTVNGNSIIANTLNGNVITAGTINGNSIAANTVNGNTIIANTLNGNSIQAFSINGGVAFIAGTIKAEAIAANTITFENLAIGAVTQSKSTISDPIVQPVPFTNIPNTWPANTRCIVPSGGVTIVPSTDPQSSANTEYVEGSRIQISYSVKMYVDPVGNNQYDDYNLVEIWKSGATSVYDRGYNTLRHSYMNGNTNNSAIRNQTLHAYGFGQLDSFSNDGGATWQAFANIQPAANTISAAINFNTGNAQGNLGTQLFGQLQGNSTTQVSWGYREGNGSSIVNQVGLEQNLSIPGAVSWNAAEFMPYTGGNGYGTINSAYPEMIAVGQSGTIWFSSTLSSSPIGQNETSGTLKNLNSLYGGQPTGGGQYTAIAAGQTGTVLKSIRSVGSTSTWSPKFTYLLDANGNVDFSNPLLTDLYGIAADDSVQSGSSKWVAVGQYGMIQVSVDNGETWKQVESPTPADLNAVRYGANKWIAVGDNGTILLNQGNIEVANDWTQINTSNLNYSNGTNYGPITGNANVARSLNTIDYSYVWDTFNVGGQGIILNFPSGNNTPRVANVFSPSESLSLTRMTFFGSWPNVANVSRPLEEQRILNNQIFSGTILDTGYVQGQETTYYLVIGNMASRQILAGQIFLQVQEIKR